jgi:phage baseplate assembly protein W
MEYLSLPLRLKEDYLARADSTEESISYAVGLLLSTPTGTMEFLPDFGCSVWDLEFSDIDTANKSEVRASLRNAIDTFEKRLYNVTVQFTKATDSGSHSLGMRVRVTGNYREEGEEKKFEGTYGLG